MTAYVAFLTESLTIVAIAAAVHKVARREMTSVLPEGLTVDVQVVTAKRGSFLDCLSLDCLQDVDEEFDPLS